MTDDLTQLFGDFERQPEGDERAPFTLKARGTGPFREKYRPQTLSEIIPTCAIDQVRNQIDNPGASQIYLFEGPTGTGKTTTARILAKALNCQDNNTFNKPCLQCENCKSYDKSYDKIELNAANQNKVEDIRQLVEDMRYAPSVYDKKIYILDEVQRLTSAAQQVLLTELEEPYSHLVVFLCTTDVKDITKALVDRACRITFSDLTAENARSAILQVLSKEGITDVDDDILTSFYVKSRGSVRALLNNIQAYTQNGFDPDLWEEDESTPEVRALFKVISTGDWPGLVKQLKKYNVRKDAESLRFGLENFIRGVILNSNSVSEASLHGQALMRMQGSLLEERSAAAYNSFVLKCLRACGVYKSKNL